MDVYLAREAEKSIEAWGMFPGRKGAVGLLLGHTRGKRFFVERLFVAPGRSWPSLDDFYALDRLFEGRVIGFFGILPDNKTKRGLLAPFAVGKAYLEIKVLRPSGRFAASASVVDFDGRFRFVRIPLRLERTAGPAGRGRR
jgi:hypothetical protein